MQMSGQEEIGQMWSGTSCGRYASSRRSMRSSRFGMLKKMKRVELVVMFS